ncbi:MAG: class I SAM-dependent methyltransferase [Chloroflexi bacterium]|nr:class I SAM-dependent methyltransferase [Chloroflexota bacterium]
MSALDAYADDELAALYDLVYQSYDEDLPLYEEFARRGESPSLELGVGTGRVAVHLARAGFRVVGLDSSRRMLARLEALVDAEAAQRLRLVEGDMRDFDLGGETFDLIYCALDTFEHLLTTEDQLACLRCVAKHLSKGGVFVAELRSLTAVDWSEEPSPLRLEWVRPDPATGQPVAKLSSVTSSRARQLTMFTLMFDRTDAEGIVHRRTFDVTLRATGRYEMELLLGRAGLRLTAVYGGTDLSPFDDDSDTMVIVAELEGA